MNFKIKQDKKALEIITEKQVYRCVTDWYEDDVICIKSTL